MFGFTRIIIGMISTVIFLIAGYFLFKTNRVFDIILPENGSGSAIRSTVINARDIIYDKIDDLIEPVTDKAGEMVDDAVQKATDEVGGVINKAKQDAAESIKKSLNQKIDTITGAPMTQSGIVTRQTASLIENFPLGFSVKKGAPSIFIIKDKENSSKNFSYIISWGDGKKDSGEVISGGASTVYHIWNKIGEYNIEIQTESGDEKKNFSSYVLVYE